MYERKREFLNGVNEKVSNMLWIPPLYTTTEETITSKLPHIFQSDPQKYTEMDSDEIQNVEIVSFKFISKCIHFSINIQYF